MALSSWQKLSCGHSQTTEPDQEGYALCLRCGAVFAARLTRHIFDKQMAAARKAFGVSPMNERNEA